LRRALVSPRGAQILPANTGVADDRALDPWMVLADWQRASDLRVAVECRYRDYWRTVVERGPRERPSRLFVDTKTGMPVKLDRREAHILWGDVFAEYVWSIWAPVPGTRAVSPQYAFRLVDGEVNHQRQFGPGRMVDADSAIAMEIPAGAATTPPQTVSPDTVRVSPTTWLLVTRAYTNVVTLQRDTVFILDAQTSEKRAASDSAWIGKLFPGRHPVVLVVSDLAWPHIAGVRYWVAQGATIVSHEMSRAFLQRVVDRRWTLEPDLLERRRGTARMRFVGVTTGATLAGGAIEVRPIDGIGSEGALMAFLPAEAFLYAGDYVQPGGPNTFSAVYAREVHAAVQRQAWVPSRFAAMHVPLTEWQRLQLLTGLP
jgi:hypothetical protein